MGKALDEFFAAQQDALTFDDVLLVPGHSRILPHQVCLETRLTTHISLGSPLVSAAMDTVTDHRLAIPLARECQGIGIIHRNMPFQQQAEEVLKVKKADNWIITDPITLPPDASIAEAKRLMLEKKIAGIPIVQNTKLLGIVTRRDLKYDFPLLEPVATVMTKEHLVTVREHANFTIDEAKRVLYENRKEKLLLVDQAGNLKGMITWRDIEKIEMYPHASRDDYGRLLVGAAIGTQNWEARADALITAGVDVLVIDTAHGHAEAVLEVARQLKRQYDVELIGGNVATAEGTKALLDCGVDAVKVGVGPGSICTTRVIGGIGVPQLTAIYECAKIAASEKVPVIADGGIKYSGDILKALAVGASTIMIGSLLAGTEEAPGDKVLYQGRSYKVYRGMGSEEAIKEGLGDRYAHEQGAIIAQGIEGMVPYKGLLKDNVEQLLGGVRAGMGYIGAASLPELWEKGRLIRVSQAGLRESHPHGVLISKEAKNYQVT